MSEFEKVLKEELKKAKVEVVEAKADVASYSGSVPTRVIEKHQVAYRHLESMKRVIAAYKKNEGGK